MARRIIATAEVQVVANNKQAEAGLESLTSSFRQVGAQAERAAERMEAAFFQGSTSATQGFRKITAAAQELLEQMRQTDARAKKLAEGFEPAIAAAKRLARTDMNAAAVMMLHTLENVAGAAGLVEAGLHQAGGAAAMLARKEQEAADAAKEIADAAERVRRAFRDVGQEIELVMAGGTDGLENDIRDLIRRLNDMEGEFRDVGRIGEQALEDIFTEFESDAAAANRALIRLESQLRQVATVGDTALEGLDNDANQATAALHKLDRAAAGVDSRVGGMARNVSGDLRGMIGLLGAAGIGMAATNVTRWGLEMTVQLDKSRAMFLGLTDSVEGANEMLERMIVFARNTPYNLANVTDAAAQLLAVGDGFGVTTRNIEDYLTSFGNAIAMTGGGDEHFTRLVRVFGQMSSSGKVLGQDMNQLAQNLPGFDVWQALADGAGTSVEHLRELQNLGTLDELLTGNEAVKILVEAMEGIPGAAGAMERRMDTLGGALEKFKETAQFAVSRGLQPFAETAQDTLANPVILNAVEDLAAAFGDLASKTLTEIAPELDDLAVAVTNFLDALDAWAPVMGHAVDILADFTNWLAPAVKVMGEATDAVLSFGGGLGKLGAGAAMFAVGGPFGIAAGLLTAVSGAMDLVMGSSEAAADMTRQLAAAQQELNVQLQVGEPELYSEAQQLSIDTATMLRDTYGELADEMLRYGVSVPELSTAFQELAAGHEVSSATAAELLAVYDNGGQGITWTPSDMDEKVIEQLEAYGAAFEANTETVAAETAATDELLLLSGIEYIGNLDAKEAREAAYTEAVAAYWQEQTDLATARMDAEEELANRSTAVTEDNLDAIRTGLEAQVDAYEAWNQSINDSTDGAKLSMSSVAEEVENDVTKMIAAINENSMSTAQWQNNIVTAGAAVVNSFGGTQAEGEAFMAFLGDMGPESAPAVQALVDNYNMGGDDIAGMFAATKTNAAVFATDMTGALGEATDAVPSLAEEISKGNVTIDEILAELPTLMAETGVDMETALGGIDLTDEATVIGEEVVAGIISALNAGGPLVAAAAARLAAGIPTMTRQALRVSSPSRVMFEIGEFVVEGLIGGMQSMSDEAYAEAAMVASMLSGGIADHFAGAEDPQEEARKFAKDVADAVVTELLAEQEAVADAAEALAEAAADRLSEAWDRVKDRFHARDMREAVDEAKNDLAEARNELESAQALSGIKGAQARAVAERRVMEAQAAVDALRQLDTAADLAADAATTAFKRGQEDAAAALIKAQEDEVASIQRRIDSAQRNLDPAARQVAEADMVAAKERHAAEQTALDRRQEDEAEAQQRRLDNEDKLREAAIDAKQSELDAFEDALDDIVKSIADAIKNIPKLIENVTSAERNQQEAFMDQFERMLENLTAADAASARALGGRAGLTPAEVDELVNAAVAATAAERQATSAQAGVGNLLNVLSSGLYTIGANGALGIAAGISAEAASIANAMIGAMQAAVNASLAALQINSPSRVTADLLGRPMAEGIAAGLTATIPEVGLAMTGLLDSVVRGTGIPSSSQLVDGLTDRSTSLTTGYSGPLVTMPGAIIQDATDADLVAQRLVVALGATGVTL